MDDLAVLCLFQQYFSHIQDDWTARMRNSTLLKAVRLITVSQFDYLFLSVQVNKASYRFYNLTAREMEPATHLIHYRERYVIGHALS